MEVPESEYGPGVDSLNPPKTLALVKFTPPSSTRAATIPAEGSIKGGSVGDGVDALAAAPSTPGSDIHGPGKGSAEPLGIYKVECMAPGCSVTIMRQPSKLLQLCPRHATAREGLFRQASRKDRDLADQLIVMERDRPEELLEHIEHFAQSCPAPGKGKKWKEWDWSRVKRHRSSGIRDEGNVSKRPLCQEDFVEWYTLKCPRYQRLSESAAHKKRRLLFNDATVRRDQVDATNADGESIGKVWRLWVAVDEVEKSIQYKDSGFTHELEDQTKNPTEAIIQSQIEKAQSSHDDDQLELETGLVRINISGRPQIGSADRSTAPPGAKAAAKSSASGRGKGAATGGGAKNNPLVLASKARTKTTKEFCEAERLLKKAHHDANHVLETVAPKVLAGSDISADPSLELLRNRLTLVKLAMDTRGGKEALDPSEQLYLSALEDPYLRDCQSTLLADRDCCQTYGAVKYCRQITFDMQPSAGHVEQLLTSHRNALEVLRKIAECCIKECEAWVSGVNALLKAKSEEEKAAAKAKHQEEKRQEAIQKRMLAKDRKEEEKAREKERKAEEKAREGGGDGNPEGTEEDGNEHGKSKKKRQRNRCGQSELTEDDPELLHSMFKLSRGALGVSNDVDTFIASIAETPGAACMARLNRGPLKKVLSEDESFTRQTLNNVQKLMLQECSEFGDKAREAFKNPNANPDSRTTFIADGPAESLAMDSLLSMKLYENQERYRDFSMSAAVLDRNHLATKIYDKSMEARNNDEAASQKEAKRMSGIAWVAQKRGGVMVGSLPVSSGTFMYQLEGQKLIACLSTMECLGLMHAFQEQENDGDITPDMAADLMPELIRFMQTVTFDFLEASETVSLRYGYLTPGDILFLPAGSILLEKSVVADNIMLRVASPIMSSDVVDSCIFNASIRKAEVNEVLIYAAGVFGSEPHKIPILVPEKKENKKEGKEKSGKPLEEKSGKDDKAKDNEDEVEGEKTGSKVKPAKDANGEEQQSGSGGDKDLKATDKKALEEKQNDEGEETLKAKETEKHSNDSTKENEPKKVEAEDDVGEDEEGEGGEEDEDFEDDPVVSPEAETPTTSHTDDDKEMDAKDFAELLKEAGMRVPVTTVIPEPTPLMLMNAPCVAPAGPAEMTQEVAPAETQMTEEVAPAENETKVIEAEAEEESDRKKEETKEEGRGPPVKRGSLKSGLGPIDQFFAPKKATEAEGTSLKAKVDESQKQEKPKQDSKEKDKSEKKQKSEKDKKKESKEKDKKEKKDRKDKKDNDTKKHEKKDKKDKKDKKEKKAKERKDKEAEVQEDATLALLSAVNKKKDKKKKGSEVDEGNPEKKKGKVQASGQKRKVGEMEQDLQLKKSGSNMDELSLMAFANLHGVKKPRKVEPKAKGTPKAKAKPKPTPKANDGGRGQGRARGGRGRGRGRGSVSSDTAPAP